MCLGKAYTGANLFFTHPFIWASVHAKISQDSEWGAADGMHPYFLGGGTNPDRVRELSRSTESGLPGSHMGTV